MSALALARRVAAARLADRHAVDAKDAGSPTAAPDPFRVNFVYRVDPGTDAPDGSGTLTASTASIAYRPEARGVTPVAAETAQPSESTAGPDLTASTSFTAYRAEIGDHDAAGEAAEAGDSARPAESPTRPDLTASTASIAYPGLSADPAFAGWDGSLAGGVSARLLAALRRAAGTGCADSARQAVALADYLAACDRGEVTLPGHPADAALKEWNRVAESRAVPERQTAAAKPRHGPPIRGTLLPADGDE